MTPPADSSVHPVEPRQRVLLVDDTPANLDLLTRTLEPLGYDIVVATTGEAALRVAGKSRPDLILLDVVMPGIDGLETCRRLKADEATRHIPILFISARNQTQSLVEGFAAGAVDYIAKPFAQDEVRTRVETHLQIAKLTRQLRERNETLETTIHQLRHETGRRQQAETQLEAAGERLSLLSALDAERWGLAAFVGRSKTIAKILADVRRLQNFTGVNVLVHGESGTGKELIARALHFGSNRSERPFIPVNCVAIPQELAESMLFGHVRGAFTGATADRKGLFELADGGTLFLDEIGDMPPLLQAKLLRVLEDGCVTPVGATRSKQVRVRIVAATNADLQERVEDGRFRQDLYFRLAGYVVNVPPLRDRREDIPLLAAHFLGVFTKEMGLPAPALTAAALVKLKAHGFPGNVRELKNVIERSLIECGGDVVDAEHLHLMPLPGRRATATADDIPLNLEAAESALIKRALDASNGNVTEAARRLGVNRTRLYRRRMGEQV